MPWIPWSSSNNNETLPSRSRDQDRPQPSSWFSPRPPTDLSWYLSPDVLLPTIVLTTSILGGRRLYKLYFRRIHGATSITEAFWRRRSLFGYVTSVGDGDGFRMFHTPGGMLAGWGWFPGRKIPTGKALKDNTISVRIAGVDAPEAAHFGLPAQPGAKEALSWLTSYVLHRRVRAQIWKKDQYDRAVATVYIRKGILRRDVGYQMLKLGLATVYEAKTGAEFGDLEEKYRAAQTKAQKSKKGIWSQRFKVDFETPREYKSRTKGDKVLTKDDESEKK